MRLFRRLVSPASPSPSPAGEVLTLGFDERQRARLDAVLPSGERVGIVLPRGTVLRDGDCLLADDGSAITIVAASEALLEVRGADARELARCAYHLGNRHVAVEVGDGVLRLAYDHVLRRMLEGLGAQVTEVLAPFQPEIGAYAPHGHASYDEHRHDTGELPRARPGEPAGRAAIHEFGEG